MQKPTSKRTGRPLEFPERDDLHLYLTKRQGRWLRQRAHDTRKSKAFVIRQLIEKEMQSEDRT